jgi:hypothetical protein
MLFQHLIEFAVKYINSESGGLVPANICITKKAYQEVVCNEKHLSCFFILSKEEMFSVDHSFSKLDDKFHL